MIINHIQILVVFGIPNNFIDYHYSLFPGYFLFLRTLLPLVQKSILLQYNISLVQRQGKPQATEMSTAANKLCSYILREEWLIGGFIEMVFNNCNVFVYSDVMFCMGVDYYSYTGFRTLDVWLTALKNERLKSDSLNVILNELKRNHDCLTEEELQHLLMQFPFVSDENEATYVIDELLDNSIVVRNQDKYTVVANYRDSFSRHDHAIVILPPTFPYSSLFSALDCVLRQEHVFVVIMLNYDM